MAHLLNTHSSHGHIKILPVENKDGVAPPAETPNATELEAEPTFPTSLSCFRYVTEF